MNHVVMFSGGVGSWAAAKRVAERHGADDLTLLFTDTLIEDEDTYRFLREAAANVGGTLVEIADGRTPWEVFRDARFLGNTRVARCSHDLKQKVADRWLTKNCDPAATVCYVGIDWTEEHRFSGSPGWDEATPEERREQKMKPGLRRIMAEKGWRYEAPLCEPPYLAKEQVHEMADREGLEKQRLYRLGMPHANCGGGCVKMGQGGFARLYMQWPERFAEWERNEEALRAELGNVAILRDRRGKRTRPLPLRALRERLEAGAECDLFDIGGCGCFVDMEEAP